ncbi:MAG: hypothetical protein H0X51_02695 [Parachlamydiaceae bacterium]|nr:hypothetical protein [Parachlamydiaceae bacterium]
MNSVSLQAPNSSLHFERRFCNALNACFIFNLFDDAVANMLCLETYYHGTSPNGYHLIMKNGADPAFGGKESGESGLHKALKMEKTTDRLSAFNCEKRFFVFGPKCPLFLKRFQPRVYAIGGSTGENWRDGFLLEKIIRVVVSIIEGFCSPILKFRFLQSKTTHFQVDDTFRGCNPKNIVPGIHYTEEVISKDKIGLHGSLKVGFDGHLRERISKNRKQFALGLVQLVAAVALIGLFVFGAIHSITFAKALCIYTVVKGTFIAGRFFIPLVQELPCYKKRVGVA